MTLHCYCLPAIQTPLANKFFQTHKVRGRATKQDQVWVVKQVDLIAACRVQNVDHHAFLSTVFVATDFRGQGVAKMMLKQVVEHNIHGIYTFAYRDVVPLYLQLDFECVDAHSLSNTLQRKFASYTQQGRDIIPMYHLGKIH
ncbi:GNAT family N-acetyltransferase [Pseudoalteromonas sp. SMS1]|uniref:GNAT family N-acetyltransferase n=1 Tax=Pseudoalteromonas sp. SMS1 TaxID=2908894 RepID=UPI001F281678|nr:GNAT family N-acetyltransferase [Pseudoalteromonas sp. SMS1]MCF2857977.1 GNAT family N-acetyltransferase [Pseudoalteromonas sp. SMS1]